MSHVSGLKGTDGREISCLFIESGAEVDIVLRNNMVATAADDNGAFNIWKDDDGNIRCESMRYCRTVEEKTYKSIEPAIKWANKWINLIK